jgi:predicted NAD/FAD-binding protein
MDRRANIAIIGSGISGLTAAHLLHRRHQVTLYEAADYLGGHTATIDVELHGRHWAVDTGFIVFNDWTYPNFIALLQELEVPWQRSDMSFSLRCERTGLEYNGSTVNQLFAQRRNALRPSFLRMIHDILRFNREARVLLRDPSAALTLAQYLRQGGYSRAFIERYLVPMGRAIWSVGEAALLGFPARFFVEFFDRHGFLNVNDRPVWQAIRGGSREYVRRLVQPFQSHVRLRTPVAGVRREADRIIVRTRAGELANHDYVVFATHSDQTLAMLEAPSRDEAQLLAAFPYQENEVVLHTDTRLLPRSPRARAAWNYHQLAQPQERVALTYNMNVLQRLTAPEVFLVTLNLSQDIDPARVLGRYVYHHPVYTPEAVAAQRRWGEINGGNRSFFCGAYWGCGFHEDGVVSALRAVDALHRQAGSGPLQALRAQPRAGAREARGA